MPKWLQRIRRRELQRAVFQSHQSVSYLLGRAEGLGDQDLWKRLQSLLEANSKLTLQLNSSSIIERQIASAILEINQSARAYYSQDPYSHHKSFDQHFRPLQGWKRYLKSLDD